jgi:hypothetical protein
MKINVETRTSIATEEAIGNAHDPMKMTKWRAAMLPYVMVATNEAARPKRTVAARMEGVRTSEERPGKKILPINEGSEFGILSCVFEMVFYGSLSNEVLTFGVMRVFNFF